MTWVILYFVLGFILSAIYQGIIGDVGITLLTLVLWPITLFGTVIYGLIWLFFFIADTVETLADRWRY